MAKKNGNKQVLTKIKVQLNAGKATPAPPLGPALGQHGVNIMEFCKAFNDQTKEMGGDVCPVEISVYADRSFTFIIKTPPASYLILKKLKLKKGSSVPNVNKVGRINRKQLEEIAEVKMKDLNATTMDQAVKIIAGSARSMGVQVD